MAFRAEGAVIASGWPAAGIAAIAVLSSRGSRLTAATGILLGVAMANLLVGREPALAIGYGVANAASAYVVAQLVSRGGSEARLDGIRDVARFLLAALAGGVTTALIGGVTALLIVDADLWSTCISLFASHGSALLVVAPLGLVSLRLRRGARPHEVVLQLFIFVVLLVLVFWPGTVLPLSFVSLAALLWAAFRLPTLVVAVELSIMGIVATRLTDLGGGPFADCAVSDPAVAIGLLQNFLVIYAGAALFVSAARNGWGPSSFSWAHVRHYCAVASSVLRPEFSSPRSSMATICVWWGLMPRRLLPFASIPRRRRGLPAACVSPAIRLCWAYPTLMS